MSNKQLVVSFMNIRLKMLSPKSGEEGRKFNFFSKDTLKLAYCMRYIPVSQPSSKPPRESDVWKRIYIFVT